MRRLDPSSYNVFLVLIAAIVAAGAILVYRLRRDVEDDSGSISDDEILKGFERAYYAGEMDEAEFRSVTASLRGRPAAWEKPAPIPEQPPDPKPEPFHELPPDELRYDEPAR